MSRFYWGDDSGENEQPFGSQFMPTRSALWGVGTNRDPAPCPIGGEAHCRSPGARRASTIGVGTARQVRRLLTGQARTPINRAQIATMTSDLAARDRLATAIRTARVPVLARGALGAGIGATAEMPAVGGEVVARGRRWRCERKDSCSDRHAHENTEEFLHRRPSCGTTAQDGYTAKSQKWSK